MGTHACEDNIITNYVQYKFYVDGEWQHDEQQPYVREDIGPINIILVRRSNNLPSISRAGIPSRSRMEVDHNVYGHLVSIFSLRIFVHLHCRVYCAWIGF